MQSDEIKIVKFKKGEPTVIDWNGERWVRDKNTVKKKKHVGGVVNHEQKR